MKNKIYISIIIFSLIFTAIAFSQKDRLQNLGEPKKKKNLTILLKGDVKSEATGQPVPDADVTVKETTRQQVIAETKTDQQGKFEVEVPKGMDIEVKAEAPEFFFDAFKIRVPMEDTTLVVEHNFQLPSELRLRLNFPTGKYDNPYPFILDEDGNETENRWQVSVEQVADNVIKYKDYIAKVVITGHTDSDGPAAANKKLGQNRANFLMEELQKTGVSATIMEATSSGEDELLEKRDGEDTKSWKKRCRRVVMTKEMTKK